MENFKTKQKFRKKRKMKIISILLLLISINIVSAQKTKLKVGDRVPYFSLLDQNGYEFNTKDYIGKKSIVLFFYPKDFAAVCEAQACSFRDNYSKFEDLDALVVGVNPGYLVTHKEFSLKNKLQYPILADKEGTVRKMFGVPRLFLSKSPKRYTFIIDKYGIISNIYYDRRANVNKHVEEALFTLHNDKI